MMEFRHYWSEIRVLTVKERTDCRAQDTENGHYKLSSAELCRTIMISKLSAHIITYLYCVYYHVILKCTLYKRFIELQRDRLVQMIPKPLSYLEFIHVHYLVPQSSIDDTAIKT
jgi:hypothetical protein